MNIAVAQGADPGETFAEYVEFLADSGYVPQGGDKNDDRPSSVSKATADLDSLFAMDERLAIKALLEP